MAKARGKKKSAGLFSRLFSSRKSKILAIVIAFGAVGASLALYSSAQTRYFSPTANTTRAHMAAFLYRAAGSPEIKTSKCGPNAAGPFKDVRGDNQFCNAIVWMSDKKITTGDKDGNFKPNDPVTRQTAAVFLYRLDGTPTLSARTISPCSGGANSTGPFKDVKAGHQFCKEISYAKEKGYMAGNSSGNFNPTGPMPRQQIAQVLYNRAGKPAPQARSALFADVKKDTTFYNAIQWIGEEKIAVGSNKPLPVPSQEKPASGTTSNSDIWTGGGRPPASSGNSSGSSGNQSTGGNQAAAPKPAIQGDKLWKQHMCYPEGLANKNLSEAQKRDKGARVRDLQNRLRKMHFQIPQAENGSLLNKTTVAVDIFYAAKTKGASRLGPGCFNADTMLEAFRKAEKEKWDARPFANSLAAFFNTVANPTPPPAVVDNRPPAAAPADPTATILQILGDYETNGTCLLRSISMVDSGPWTNARTKTQCRNMYNAMGNVLRAAWTPNSTGIKEQINTREHEVKDCAYPPKSETYRVNYGNCLAWAQRNSSDPRYGGKYYWGGHQIYPQTTFMLSP